MKKSNFKKVFASLIIFVCFFLAYNIYLFLFIPCHGTVVFDNATKPNMNNKVGFISTQDERSYRMYGNSIAELAGQISRCGVPMDSWRTYSAVTKDYVSYYYDYKNKSLKGEICELSNVKVGINSTIMHPDLDMKDIGQSISKKWRKYLDNLMIHENGHVKINENNAKKFYEFLQSIEKSKSCISEENIKNSFDSMLKQMNLENDNYDKSTWHGFWQGVSLI